MGRDNNIAKGGLTEKEKIQQDLIKMGYRSIDMGIWGKPVAFHLFVFNEVTLKWHNFFRAANGDSICVWNSEEYKETDWEVDGEPNFLLFLKYTEQSTKISVRNPESKFEFLTSEEIYKVIL